MWLGLTMIMIVGATFAWFSENRTVEANGMSVQAEASKNLLISNASDGTYGISAASTLTAVTKLAPSSTTNLSSFFAATTDTKQSKVDYATGNLLSGAAMEAVTPTTENPNPADTVVNVAKHTFYVKLDGISGAQLYKLYVNTLTVQNNTPADAAQNISKALRVGVKCGDNVYIYAPVTGASTTYSGITSTAAATGAVTNLKAAPASTDVLAATVVVGTTLTVEVFIWYEGQDPACTSANSINVEQLNVKLTFTANDTNE